MAKLSSEKRDQLKDSDFGIPEKRMYPLHDKAHIESAVKLFGHAETKYKKSLARKILRRAKEYNMDTSGWKQVLSFAQEAVPPMSNGTSLGNIPPGLTAPYEYSEGDELMSRVNSLGNTDMFTFAKNIVNEIHAQVEKDRKPPTGNQNCQLCTWCAEARFRGMNVLPRPIYSPRDPALAVPGENIVMNPVKEKIATQRQVIETVRGAVNSRWYVHVNWKDSEGGHEFLVVNINDYAYIMDAQAGMLKEIDETDSTNSYFRDINYANSYMVRLDTKKFNTELFNEMNDPSKVLPWDEKLDIPYMKKEGMLKEDEDVRFIRLLVPSDEATPYLKSDPELSQYWEELNKATQGEVLIDPETRDQIGHVFVHTNKKDKGFIFNLKVKPEYRRKGFGWILTDDAVRRFGGEDLTVDADNTPAVNLYLKYGFEIYKKGQWHYDPPKDELWMKYDRSKLTQESTNIFESDHFSKYKDDVLGFNDDGMAVMKKCDCGGNISVSMKGEPVYTCESCGKTYGVVAYQEGAFQDLKNGVNPYSDKMVFHVTPEKHADGQVWKPRVPDYLDPYNPEDTGFEDNTTPRICFSTSIEGALNGITVNIQRQSADTFDKMYVYVPEKPWKEYKHKTNKQLVNDKLVYDANVTREVWIMEPVRMKLYGVIRVDQIADAKRKSVVPTSKGQKDTRNYFTYKWHWVVKPKVLKKATKFDYSPERVIDDLCIDIKKFKYGLIRDGKLQTGNVSDKDYDKYWVFHSGETVDQAGGGNCYDMVEYEAGYLDAFGVAYKKYFMNFTDTKNTKTINTHTICVVPHNGKFIYIEQAFKRIVDEWGYERKKVFDKLNDIFEYVAEVSAEYENQDLNYGVWDYTNAEIDYGTPIKNFMEWIMTKCKMVYDGEASKPKSIKEGFKLSRFNSTRFYQEEEEYLSEDITVGDIDLDDEKDNPEDIQTDETSVTRNTPEKVETSEEKETTEEPEEIEPIENFEDIDIGADEVPEYMKDRLSEEDKKEFESDDNNEMDVNNVELGSFGSDTSDVQNDYDQKEVDILMKLMASEADAMNEYMDGAKETNVDVLRRLYADIANEERFHMEQLLFAKSELTGEKYIPRDPDVKSEYEELLKMGMDENTAMQTAVDKCHIRGISVSVDNDVDEMKETQEEVETLEYAVEMFAENFDSFMKEFEMSDREKSIDKFVQEYLAMEAVTPEGKEVHKGLELGRNPITVLMKAADFVIKVLVELCRKIKVFLDRVKRSSTNFKNYVQQIKMDPNGWKTFFEPIMLYFMPHYDSLNGKRVAIMPREMYQWYMLAYDTVVECGKGMNININIQPDAIAQQYRTQNINGDIKQGAEMLNSIHLSREPMVKPADDDARNELIDMFMGYSDIIGEDGKSYNMLGSYQKFADIWRELLKQTEAMMKALVSAQNQVNENPQLRNTYELCMTGLNAVIKSSKAFAAAITKDINTIIKLDSDVYEAVRNKDNKRIEENEVAKNQNQAYKDRFGKVRNMNDANPPK